MQLPRYLGSTLIPRELFQAWISVGRGLLERLPKELRHCVLHQVVEPSCIERGWCMVAEFLERSSGSEDIRYLRGAAAGLLPGASERSLRHRLGPE